MRILLSLSFFYTTSAKKNPRKDFFCLISINMPINFSGIWQSDGYMPDKSFRGALEKVR